MKTVNLGTQGLKVSAQGYGCMGLTTAYGSNLSKEKIAEMLASANENGVYFWDTANLYCYADVWRLLRLQSPVVCQEESIGPVINKIGRDKIKIATKTGVRLIVFPKLNIRADGSEAFIRQQCEDSLRRLQVSTLDLFYLHRIDQNIPIEVSMKVMRDLVEEGKVKYVGLSECSAKTIRRAHRVHPLSCVQMEYSLWARDIEAEVIPTCAELGIGLVAYSPLGRGFFSGEIRDTSKLARGDSRRFLSPRFQGEALQKNLEMLDRVEAIAKKKGVSTSQLALAWVQHQEYRLKGAGLVCIPGTTKKKNLLSNVAAVDVKLTKQELEDLEVAVTTQQVVGDRYADSHAIHNTDNNPELPPGEAEKYYRK